MGGEKHRAVFALFAKYLLRGNCGKSVVILRHFTAVLTHPAVLSLHAPGANSSSADIETATITHGNCDDLIACSNAKRRIQCRNGAGRKFVRRRFLHCCRMNAMGSGAINLPYVTNETLFIMGQGWVSIRIDFSVLLRLISFDNAFPG